MEITLYGRPYNRSDRVQWTPEELALSCRFRDRAELLPAPEDPDHVKVLQWLFFAVSTLEASDPEMTTDDGPAPASPLAATLEFLEQHLSGRTFVATDSFTIADIALANGLKWFGSHALDEYHELARYFAEHTSRPAFRKVAAQSEYSHT